MLCHSFQFASLFNIRIQKYTKTVQNLELDNFSLNKILRRISRDFSTFNEFQSIINFARKCQKFLKLATLLLLPTHNRHMTPYVC